MNGEMQIYQEGQQDKIKESQYNKESHTATDIKQYADNLKQTKEQICKAETQDYSNPEDILLRLDELQSINFNREKGLCEIKRITKPQNFTPMNQDNHITQYNHKEAQIDKTQINQQEKEQSNKSLIEKGIEVMKSIFQKKETNTNQETQQPIITQQEQQKIIHNINDKQQEFKSEERGFFVNLLQTILNFFKGFFGGLFGNSLPSYDNKQETKKIKKEVLIRTISQQEVTKDTITYNKDHQILEGTKQDGIITFNLEGQDFNLDTKNQIFQTRGRLPALHLKPLGEKLITIGKEKYLLHNGVLIDWNKQDQLLLHKSKAIFDKTQFYQIENKINLTNNNNHEYNTHTLQKLTNIYRVLLIVEKVNQNSDLTKQSKYLNKAISFLSRDVNLSFNKKKLYQQEELQKHKNQLINNIFNHILSDKMVY